jgi:hypothetical protein
MVAATVASLKRPDVYHALSLTLENTHSLSDAHMNVRKEFLFFIHLFARFLSFDALDL